MNQLHFFHDDLARRYGHPLQRIPIDLGLSCPHRYSNGKGGCAFCDLTGSRARHLKPDMSLEEQVRSGINYVERRYHAGPPYIAYFQAFTGTNAPVSLLREKYETVLGLADFKVLIIGTRPDCLPEDCLDYLQELSTRYEVWVELGVQSANDDTLKRINRGHDFASTQDAVRRLAQRGIKVAAHLILGLPGEGRDDFLATAKAISELPFSGVKIHNLMVLRGTAVARMYDKGLVSPMNEYEYAAALAAVLRVLPEDMLLMRISSEAPEENLLAPKWWMKKSEFLNMFQRFFEQNASLPVDADAFLPCQTGDGSYTLYHPRYKQHFHSIAGAWEESLKKYIEPCRLKEKLEAGENITVLEIGLGMGYNVSALAELASTIRRGKVFMISMELDPNVLDAALTLPEHKGAPMLQTVKDSGRYEDEFVSLDVMWGDARDSAIVMKSHCDAIFLDAFSPDTNPELWTVEFIRELKDMLKDEGFIATYCSAFPLIGAFLQNGVSLYESRPFGRKRSGLVAGLDANPWLPPVSEKDFLIASRSTAGVPYRDPGLKNTREQIRLMRTREVALLRGKGVPKWYNPNKPMSRQESGALKRTDPSQK